MLQQNDVLALQRDLGIQRQAEADELLQLLPHFRVAQGLAFQPLRLRIAGVAEEDQEHLLLLVGNVHGMQIVGFPRNLDGWRLLLTP